MRSKPLQTLAVLLSIVIFVISMARDGFCIHQENCEPGYFLVFGGFFALLYGGAGFAWLANPLLISSWIAVRSNKTSLVLSLFATAFAISFSFYNGIWMAAESKTYREILQLKDGYWIWCVSMLPMVIANLIIRFQKPNVETGS